MTETETAVMVGLGALNCAGSAGRAGGAHQKGPNAKLELPKCKTVALYAILELPNAKLSPCTQFWSYQMQNCRFVRSFGATKCKTAVLYAILELPNAAVPSYAVFWSDQMQNCRSRTRFWSDLMQQCRLVRDSGATRCKTAARLLKRRKQMGWGISKGE